MNRKPGFFRPKTIYRGTQNWSNRKPGVPFLNRSRSTLLTTVKFCIPAPFKKLKRSNFYSLPSGGQQSPLSLQSIQVGQFWQWQRKSPNRLVSSNKNGIRMSSKPNCSPIYLSGWMPGILFKNCGLSEFSAELNLSIKKN